MTQQSSIRAELGVADVFDAATETERRIQFLADYLQESGASGYVLGISGGLDSTVAGRLASLACQRTGTTFTAMRLPYGRQGDESDAADALAFIEPSATVHGRHQAGRRRPARRDDEPTTSRRSARTS